MRLGLAQIILLLKMSWKITPLEPICLIRCGRVLPCFMMITWWHVCLRMCLSVYLSVCLSVCTSVSMSLISSIPENRPIPSRFIKDWVICVIFFYDLLRGCPAAAAASLPSVLMQKYEDAHLNISRYVLWPWWVPRLSPEVSQNCMETKSKSFLYNNSRCGNEAVKLDVLTTTLIF